MLKKTLIGIAAVIVLLIAAALIVPAFIPVETYKEQIARQVQNATGREFAINGDMSFSLFPTLGFEAHDATLGNPEGYSEPQMASLGEVVVAVKLLPLLGGNVEIDRFVLVEPVVHLEVDKNGKPNWAFAQAGAESAQPGQDAPGQEEAPAGDGGLGVKGISLGEVRLENGTVSYTDQRNGQTVTLSRIDMDVSLPALSERMAADGSATWNGKEVKVELTVTTPESLLAGESTTVALKADSEPVRLAFDGSVTNAKALTGGGTVDLDVPSVRELAAWTGNPLEVGETGYGPLKITGKLGIEGSRYSFSDAKITFDEINGQGSLAFDGSGKVPYVKAALTVDRLDLNPYLPQESVAAAKDGEGAPAGGGAQTPQAGGTASSGWSDEPIDASGLKAVNADLDFRSGEILIRKIKIDEGAVKIALKNGRANMTLSDLKLYGGQGNGTMVLDASAAPLAVEQKFQISGVQAQPLLTDAVNTTWLEGGGEMQVNLASRGKSQRELVSNLGGNGGFKFTDGAINGINIAEIVRQIASLGLKAVFDPQAMDVPQKTDFAELSGTFKITDGMARNEDLLMLSPLLRVTGKGTANMPQRTVDYRVEPKVVGTLKGQGGDKDLKGLVVPFSIKGSWDKPQIAPDLAGMLQSSPKEALEGIVEGVTGGEGGLSIPGLLGGQSGGQSGGESGSGSGGAAPAPAPEDPGDALKKSLENLFKQ